jgi:hypothetical protein
MSGPITLAVVKKLAIGLLKNPIAPKTYGVVNNAPTSAVAIYPNYVNLTKVTGASIDLGIPKTPLCGKTALAIFYL